MHGEYERAMAPRISLTLIHLAAVVIVAWLLVGGGLGSIASWRGVPWAIASPEHRRLLMGCATVYFLRIIITAHD